MSIDFKNVIRLITVPNFANLKYKYAGNCEAPPVTLQPIKMQAFFYFFAVAVDLVQGTTVR